jgi:hypothetical protein
LTWKERELIFAMLVPAQHRLEMPVGSGSGRSGLSEKVGKRESHAVGAGVPVM